MGRAVGGFAGLVLRRESVRASLAIVEKNTPPMATMRDTIRNIHGGDAGDAVHAGILPRHARKVNYRLYFGNLRPRSMALVRGAVLVIADMAGAVTGRPLALRTIAV
jgi:hypothetical protein